MQVQSWFTNKKHELSKPHCYLQAKLCKMLLWGYTKIADGLNMSTASLLYKASRLLLQVNLYFPFLLTKQEIVKDCQWAFRMSSKAVCKMMSLEYYGIHIHDNYSSFLYMFTGEILLKSKSKQLKKQLSYMYLAPMYKMFKTYSSLLCNNLLAFPPLYFLALAFLVLLITASQI